MPAFYILCVLGILILFFLLSFIYKPIGRFVSKILQDAFDIMKEEEEKETTK